MATSSGGRPYTLLDSDNLGSMDGPGVAEACLLCVYSENLLPWAGPVVVMELAAKRAGDACREIERLFAA